MHLILSVANAGLPLCFFRTAEKFKFLDIFGDNLQLLAPVGDTRLHQNMELKNMSLYVSWTG